MDGQLKKESIWNNLDRLVIVTKTVQRSMKGSATGMDPYHALQTFRIGLPR